MIHIFCTIIGDEATVLHLVRLAGKPVGQKLERRKAFEYPVWTVPTPCGYFYLGSSWRAGRSVQSKGENNKASFVTVSFPFLFFRCVLYEHREGSHGAYRSMAASRADSARRGEISSGASWPACCVKV